MYYLYASKADRDFVFVSIDINNACVSPAELRAEELRYYVYLIFID